MPMPPLLPDSVQVLYFSAASVVFNAGLSYVSANSMLELEQVVADDIHALAARTH